MADVIYDAKTIIRGLNAIEPGLKKAMVKEMKFISKDMVKSIKNEISPISPFGTPKHTEGRGRLSWEYGKFKKTGAVMKPNNVLARFSTSRSLRFKTTSLFSVWIRNPMVALAATAGKGSGTPRYAVTREYEWRGTRRTHRNTRQGQILINKVRRSGYYNFHYDTAEQQIPDVEQKIVLVWNRYAQIITKRYF